MSCVIALFLVGQSLLYYIAVFALFFLPYTEFLQLGFLWQRCNTLQVTEGSFWLLTWTVRQRK